MTRRLDFGIGPRPITDPRPLGLLERCSRGDTTCNIRGSSIRRRREGLVGLNFQCKSSWYDLSTTDLIERDPQDIVEVRDISVNVEVSTRRWLPVPPDCGPGEEQLFRSPRNDQTETRCSSILCPLGLSACAYFGVPRPYPNKDDDDIMNTPYDDAVRPGTKTLHRDLL